MMDGIRAYALTLICTALVCGILMQLLPGGTTGKLLRTVCGAVMLSVLLAPLCRIELPDFEIFLEEFSVSGEQIAQTGAEMMEEERLQLIKAGLEAYVLERAKSLNCPVRAEIWLDAEGYPDSIHVTGEISEDQRHQLSAILSNDLGIPEENQQWTAENQKN